MFMGSSHQSGFFTFCFLSHAVTRPHNISNQSFSIFYLFSFTLCVLFSPWSMLAFFFKKINYVTIFSTKLKGKINIIVMKFIFVIKFFFLLKFMINQIYVKKTSFIMYKVKCSGVRSN